ncbi:MAG: sulfotransferase [Desulfonauticus sp.]|nr:sulfotransferase [Desulfonauticus sp.]
MKKNFNFIFLVGAPRSGTTWLQALLASHPKIITGQETHFFSAIQRFLDFYDQRDDWRKVGLDSYWPEEKKFELIAALFVEFIKPILKDNDLDFEFFLEKTPEHAMSLPLICKCFPKAKIIHIIRDARHMVASLMRVSRKNNKYVSPTLAAIIWKNFVSNARSFGKSLPKSSYLEVRYEDLRTNTKDVLSSIFNWLDLSFSEDSICKIIEKYALENVKRNKKFDSIRTTSIEPDGFFSKGSVGDDILLNKLELYRVYEICGPLLKELGYVESVPKIPLWAKICYSYKLRKLLRLREI